MVNFDISKLESMVNRKSMKDAVETYSRIMKSVKKNDVSTDTDFQNDFANFYGLKRRNDDFRRKYFLFLQQQNGKRPELSVILDHLHTKSGKWELSFASKMAHTLDPENIPIWDSVVSGKHFGFRKPYNKKKNYRDALLQCFENYRQCFMEYKNSPAGQKIIAAFDNVFPNSGISDVKKIDFVLWLDR